MTIHDTASTGQVAASAAEVYEEFFVPALFGQWPEIVLRHAGLSEGDDILDIGCGTGVLARAAARRLADSGSVTGVDVNEGMLGVAARLTDAVTWRLAPAEALPFSDGSFDRVVSQFAVMFFEDRRRSLEEMARVVRPGGSVTVATWASLGESPGYAAMVALLDRLFGTDAAGALRAPFSMGTIEMVREAMEEVFPDVSVVRHDGTAVFASLEAWVHTDIRGWTLSDQIDDRAFDSLLEAASSELADFVGLDGRVQFPAPALIASAQRR